jgi:hypothetical protein
MIWLYNGGRPPLGHSTNVNVILINYPGLCYMVQKTDVDIIQYRVQVHLFTCRILYKGELDFTHLLGFEGAI